MAYSSSLSYVWLIYSDTNGDSNGLVEGGNQDLGLTQTETQTQT